MKLSFSSNAYMHYSIEETIRRIAARGYRGIEVLADVPHAWPAFLLEERKQSIRDHLARHDLAGRHPHAHLHAQPPARRAHQYPRAHHRMLRGCARDRDPNADPLRLPAFPPPNAQGHTDA